MTGKIILIIVGILLILYGGVVAAAGSGTLFFAVWICLGGLCLASAWGIHAGIFARLPGVVRWIMAGMAGCVICILAVCLALIMTRFHSAGRAGLDAIVVLGAQVWEDGPSNSLKYRLDAAVEYLKKNEAALCVVSGGQGYNEPFSEAEGMRRYLEEAGIAPERILMEDQSTNTAENLRFSKVKLEERMDLQTAGVGIVTNDFHMYRALMIARRVGFSDPDGIASGSHPLYLPNNVLRECLAIVKDYLKG